MPVGARRLQGVLAAAAVLVLSSVAAAERPGAPLETEPAVAVHVGSGERAVLAAAEVASALDTGDAVVEMRETAGVPLVARLTPQLPPGAPLHGGRLVILRAGERRLIRLDTVFDERALLGNDLLVEALEGDGRLAVRLVGATRDGDGSDAPALVRSPGEPVAALATTPKTTRRRLEGRALTSTDLIDRAEASQELDHETAVLYRVYAIFGDARLPAAYRGSDGEVVESLYLATVAGEWDTYSPATQAALQPFFIPPAYTRSWAAPAGGQASGDVRASDPDTDYCGLLSPLWGWVENLPGKVRVWYQLSAPGDGGRAASLANTADAIIWPDIVGFMAPHEPLSDAGLACNGGSGRLDIYLSDIGRSMAPPMGSRCNNTPAYVLLNRGEGVSALAHEIFHAFQFSFRLADCLTSASYNWWTEGSAQWVMDKVFPIINREQPVAKHLTSQPEVSLDVNTDPHRYSTYLLPFYLHRTTGDATFVRRIWESCERTDAVKAFEVAVAEGWKGVWPKFALHNWNTEPVDKYLDWDRLTDSPPQADSPTIVMLDGASDKEYRIPFDLPKLSTRYEHYEFLDGSIRSVRFWNGATFDLQQTTTPEITPVWDPRPLTGADNDGVRVQALVKIQGRNWEAPADWTGRPAYSFCRDVPAERIEELVLIISNSQFLDPAKRAKPTGGAPRLYVSNVGCYKWKGTATAVTTGGGLVQSVVTNPLTWERDPVAQDDPSPIVTYRATGGGTATWTGKCSGGGEFGIEPAWTTMWTANYAPVTAVSKLTYVIDGTSTESFMLSCPPVGQTLAWVGKWLLSPFTPPLRKVSPVGTEIKGSYTPPGGAVVFTWNLRSEALP